MAAEKIQFWQGRIEELKVEEQNCDDPDRLCDIGQDLAYAKEQLAFAWQDDELDSQGLPHPWGY